MCQKQSEHMRIKKGRPQCARHALKKFQIPSRNQYLSPLRPRLQNLSTIFAPSNRHPLLASHFLEVFFFVAAFLVIVDDFFATFFVVFFTSVFLGFKLFFFDGVD